MKSLTERLTDTPEKLKAYLRERAIFDATELVYRTMQRAGVNKTELAARLGKSKGYISQVLSGEKNMTILTLADLMISLGKTIQFEAGSLAVSQDTLLECVVGACGSPEVFAWASEPAKWNVQWTMGDDVLNTAT